MSAECSCPALPALAEPHVRWTLEDLVALERRTLPSPDGRSVTFVVSCSTGPEHEVELLDDWSLVLPHDLDAERVGAAMGGYSSCLELREQVVPAVRLHLGLQHRTALPTLLGSGNEFWSVRPTLACCIWNNYPVAGLAAEHQRSRQHVLNASTLTEPLLQAVETAWGSLAVSPRPCASVAAGSCVAVQALPPLWNAGLSPQAICQVHRFVAAEGPLPMNFYLTVLGKNPDLTWIRRTVGPVQSRTAYLRLAETETWLDREHPAARSAWLRAGIPAKVLVLLSQMGYRVEDARALADQVCIDLPSAAKAIASWAVHGLSPSIEDLASLHAQGVSPVMTVDLSDLNDVNEDLHLDRHWVTLTNLAVLSCLTGSAKGGGLRVRMGARQLADVLTAKRACPPELGAAR